MTGYAVLMSSNKSETISIKFIGKQESLHSLGYTNSIYLNGLLYLAGINFSIFFLMISYDFTDKLKEIERPTNFSGYLI